MDVKALIILAWENRVEIVAILGSIHLAASTLAQHTTNDKIDTIASRFGSFVDLLSGAVGKADPNSLRTSGKPRPAKDAVRLIKHIIKGKM